MNPTTLCSTRFHKRVSALRSGASIRCRAARIRSLLLAVGLAGLSALMMPAQSPAAMLIYSLDTEFSGATAPSGSPPWVTVAMNDYGSPGSVEMTLTAPGLTGNESVFLLYLNLAPTLDPDDLTFALDAKSRAAMTTPTISTGVNAFMADGDGKYDIRFSFASGGPPETFVTGDFITYTIGGIPTLTVDSFNFNSSPAGAHGPFRMAAHVQNTGDNFEASGWIAGPDPVVPEPSSLALLVLGAIGVTGWRLLRRRR